MKSLILACCVLLSLNGYGQQTIALFNGKNLDGWYAYDKQHGKHQNASDLFTVEEDMIRLYGKNVGYLMSDSAYSNFELSLEYRWNTDESYTRRSQKKNSGVMYLVPVDAEDMLWPQGIQFQVKEGATGDFIFLQKSHLKVKGKPFEPGKSVVVERLRDATKPIGEWNTITIKVKNRKVKQLLNGKVVNKGQNASIKQGRILLQYEGYPIDFRHIIIKIK